MGKQGKQTDKNLRTIDSRYLDRIIEKIEALQQFPNVQADIIELKGEQNKGKFRMRVGFYRVIFKVVNNKPIIIEIQEIKKRDERTYN
ncbi:type II toxin-antitoxin system RelE/ParE family toxin [Glaesserella parasuis]|uniref:type II toxin-antitoxin system RelE family toxin n=1 Tax=Glaesserella parasuis TaxID=738 RepID=UPI002436EEA5|nr:type II toxin-antitoxin system RelE/ParE family toxin [Glaesserella parasuis]MDG6342413.1 type II toxin-antitoxin system RelE/ParE family toxin [Glaesserella parasuis]MDG6368550.1 type II toxin-antitoxin system RelE/ParE family toxin [Glaesserella parasuis]